jgi:hypothetical protein
MMVKARDKRSNVSSYGEKLHVIAGAKLVLLPGHLLKLPRRCSPMLCTLFFHVATWHLILIGTPNLV